jgi:diaminobutyrate-2-oxoglutarate transaminase
MQSAFALLWVSETILDMGSALMGFALGVWIFQRTGSAEQFAISVLAAAVPAAFVTPFAGALSDRFDRRWVITGCDAILAAMVTVLAFVVFENKLTVQILYGFNVIGATLASVRMPAYRAAVSVIVPKDRMTEASGLIGVTQNLLQIAAPLVAGYLMGFSGLKGVLMIDIAMVAAGAAVIFVALTRATAALRWTGATDELPIMKGIADSFFSAFRYFKTAPLMSGLAIYALLQESLLIVVTALITPLVLSTKTSGILGVILTCGALGGIAGSALLLVLRIQKRLMAWVLISDAVLSFFVLLVGFTRITALWCTYAFFALFASSASAGCANALWMRKTPRARRGSIFGLIQSLNLLATCVVMLAGGYLSERVFAPALASGGAWAGSIGAWLGSGKGQGLAFMFIVCGACSCLVSLMALAQRRLRRLDELVPDGTEATDEPALSNPSVAECATLVERMPEQLVL